MKYSLSFCFAFTILFYFGCNAPYASTNRVYKKQTKALGKELRRNPSTQTMATASAWVGTTNFNLRKPNIVVIHLILHKTVAIKP
jgi:N-acetylmuramoyl-L-alanine amidase